MTWKKNKNRFSAWLGLLVWLYGDDLQAHQWCTVSQIYSDFLQCTYWYRNCSHCNFPALQVELGRVLYIAEREVPSLGVPDHTWCFYLLTYELRQHCIFCIAVNTSTYAWDVKIQTSSQCGDTWCWQQHGCVLDVSASTASLHVHIDHSGTETQACLMLWQSLLL